MTKVVTRIAPSPTGMMHIGTARTALFNYLYAKHMGGEFVLRIEDTDKERSTDEATDVILKGLDWLGLSYDGAPVFQSHNIDRHIEVAKAMVANGTAYYDFMSEDETAAWKAANKGKAFRSTYRDRTPFISDMASRIDTKWVIRLKVPAGETVINDLVKGSIKFANENLDDLVLLRSDGTPTYNLAVVVDDHDMGITHVIRGDDHVNNTPRQKLIYEAMGWDVPEFGHIPLIYNEEGKKLSKRDGAASIMDFAAAGYLPATMRNYLARLGWGHGDSEIFSDAEAIEWFDIKDVVSAPARMNAKKLLHMNKHYMNSTPTDAMVEYVRAFMALYGATLHEGNFGGRFEEIVGLLKGNAATIPELNSAILGWAVAATRPEPDEKAFATLGDANAMAAARLALNALNVPDLPWNVESLNTLLHKLADDNGIHMKVLGAGMRAILTGRATAPDLGTILVVLGSREALARLTAAVERFEGSLDA